MVDRVHTTAQYNLVWHRCSDLPCYVSINGARSLTAGAGVILQTAQEQALDAGLVFPLTFGAQGSAMVGGALSTNAGGSNVVRYSTACELCIGIEAVLPDGSVIEALTGLR